MNLKIKVNPVFPATVTGAGGIGVSKASGVWTVEPSWDDLAVETTLSDASARQLWIYNPTDDVYTRLSVQYLLNNLPAGPEGDAGPVAGIKQTYSTTTTDSDPGAGNFRLNNATIASVTAAYLDNADADGATVSAIIDLWDDSTTTTKGTLRIEKQDDSSVWAVFTVTGSVVDGTGYRKLTLTYVATGGTFTNGDTFRLSFIRSGDKGSDGAGTGDVSAASNFGTDNRLIRSDGPTKGVQSSGVSVDDSDNVSGVAALTAATIELGHASDTTISRTGAGAIAVEGVGVALNSVSLAHTAGSVELGHATDTTLARSSAGIMSVEGKIVAMLSQAQTWAAKQSFDITIKLQQVLEKVTITASAPSSTHNFDVLTQGFLYLTSNTSTNWTLNVRGDGSNSLDSIMATGEAITIALLVTNGGTAYRMTALTIDGNAITPQWLGAAAPSAGTISKRDTYTVTIIKTGSATFVAHASFASGN